MHFDFPRFSQLDLVQTVGIPGFKLTHCSRSASIQPTDCKKAFMGIGANVKWAVVTSLLCALFLPWPADANDFPTQARIEFVLRCMDSNGGQKYENLYSCVCVIDKIAENIAYEEYVEGEVFAQLRSAPGERGGVFRDPDRASLLVEKLREITEVAEKSCFVSLRSDTAK